MTLSDLWRIIRHKPKIETEKKTKTQEELDLKLIELKERNNEAELNRFKISELKRARFNRELSDIQQSVETDIVEEDDGDEYEQDEDIPTWLAPFMPIITKKLGEVGKQGSISENAPTSLDYPQDIPTPQTQPLSDDELRTMLKEVPKSQLKMAKIMPKDSLYSMVNQKFPISRNDFERAYQILVTEF